MMAFAIGERVSDDYLPLLLEELALSGDDLRAPDLAQGHRRPPIAPFRVVIVGAGMSGLLAAHRLAAGRRPLRDHREERRRRRHVVREPLSRLPRRRAEPPLQLLVRAARRLAAAVQPAGRAARLLPRAAPTTSGSRANIRFGTEVLDAPSSARRRGDWKLTIRTPDGTTESLEANVLVSAVGQLNRPSFPTIAGRDVVRRPVVPLGRVGSLASTSPASASR